MKTIIDLVCAHIDKLVLNSLLGQLRALDNELDIKIEDIRIAQQNITVWDRINVFTNTDAEQNLKEENKIYKQIRDEHGQVITQIKDQIRTAIYQDFGVALKIQTGEVMKSIAALRVERKWGVGAKAHEYQIGGIGTLKERIGRLADMINTQFGFPPQPLDADELLEIVYDSILRKEGFVK